MVSQLAWLDHDDAQMRSALTAIELFKEESTVHEIGIGSIRDTIADVLFPGTSVLHTRARYLLFVPWLLDGTAELDLQPDRAVAELRWLEAQLIHSLLAGGETDGIVSSQARDRLRRMPSAACWAATLRYDIAPGRHRSRVTSVDRATSPPYVAWSPRPTTRACSPTTGARAWIRVGAAPSATWTPPLDDCSGTRCRPSGRSKALSDPHQTRSEPPRPGSAQVGSSNSSFFTPLIHAAISARVKNSTAPSGHLLSRTAIRPSGSAATSTQSPPPLPAPLKLLVRHAARDKSTGVIPRLLS